MIEYPTKMTKENRKTHHVNKQKKNDNTHARTAGKIQHRKRQTKPSRRQRRMQKGTAERNFLKTNAKNAEDYSIIHTYYGNTRDIYMHPARN